MLLSDKEQNIVSQKIIFNHRENHLEFTSLNRKSENNREDLNK